MMRGESHFLLTTTMGDSTSWADKDIQVTSIQAAEGLDKPLLLKGTGTGGLLYYAPPRVDLTGTTVLTAAQLFSRYLIYVSGGAGNITTPSAVAIAAYLNGSAASRNGTRLFEGAAFDLTITTVGASAVARLVGGTGVTLIGGVDAVDANTNGTFQFVFTDVTVGAETIEVRPKAGVI